MRVKYLLSLLLVFSLFVLGAVRAQEVQDPQDPDDEGVRGVFMKSRANSSNSGSGTSGTGSVSPNSGFGATTPPPRYTPKPTPRPTPRPTPKPTPRPVVRATPKPAPKNPASGQQTAGNKPPNKGRDERIGIGVVATAPTNNNGNAAVIPVALNESNIGLGYSLFLNRDDRPVRVDPGREFANGEQLRLMFEPTTNGYLYIFNTTNDGPASMLYPNADLNGGDNRIKQNFPVFVPSEKETNPDYQWLTFFGNSGREQLYVIVTREPLAGFPTGQAALRAYCTQNKDASGQCGVDKKLWASVKSYDQKGQVLIAKNQRDIGTIATDVELPNGARQIGFAPKDPPPTIIFMNASADKGVLFTKLELTHR